MNEQNEQQISEKIKNIITQNLEQIQNDYKDNSVTTSTLIELNKCLFELKKEKIKTDFIYNQIQDEHLNVFLYLLQEEGMRSIVLKILRKNIEIYPLFTNKLLEKMFQIIICRIFEDFKSKTYNDRYECFKLINCWFQYSNNNFPLIFCQGIAAMSKTDEVFKKGCLEFLRTLGVIRPDLCSCVGGFKILINSLLDVNNIDIQDNILYSLLFVINSPNKRKYFNGFGDFYKIFSVFSKIDFTNKNSPKDKNSNKQNDPNSYEIEKKRIELSKNVIKKLLKTWTGYLLIMGDYMALGSVIEALNIDTDELIQSTILNMFNEILDEEYNYIDNFSNISSSSKDYFYTNKIFFAYIFQGLGDNNFYDNIMKFIENGNKSYNDIAYKLALKYIILYSKISKTYLKLPFLNQKLRHELEQMKQDNRSLKSINLNDNEIWDNQHKEANEEDFLDQPLYHSLNKDLSSINFKYLSTEVILSLNSVIINSKSNKNYINQYSIESCRKELYSFDEKSINYLLTHTKVMETREYIKWNWGDIDSLLEVIENKKLISDKQSFLKKLLYFYLPSKNEFVNISWKSGKNELNKDYFVAAFSYGATGNKLFKILASCPEGIMVLKNKDDYVEDLINCLKNFINGNKKTAQIFNIEQIYSKMSRHIFTFIGILSSTLYGDEYLEEKGFYSTIEKLIEKNNKYDYLLTVIINNINFNSKNANEWITKVLKEGSIQIKRYVLDHIRCLFQLKKELICDIDLLLNSFSMEKENCNNVIISILTTLVINESNNYKINLTPELIETISKIDKKLLFIMMRNIDCFELLQDFIQKEITDIDVDSLVESYANYLENSAIKNMNTKSDENKNYNVFLTITLSQIEEQYNKINEFFVLKQLPFYLIILIKEKESKIIRERYIINTYMEYYSNDKIILYGKPREINQKKNIDFKNVNISILWKLGDVFIDRMDRIIERGDEKLINFDDNEYNQSVKLDDSNELIKLEKEGISLILREDLNNKGNYSIENLECNIKINPSTKQYFKTPINILTELPNNDKGTEILIKTGAIEKLLNYLDPDKINSEIKNIKSALWILAKILIHDEQSLIEKKYQVVQKILEFNEKCDDYGLKGNIIYILCFISQKNSIKEFLKLNGYSYFFNTNICYPNDINKLYIDNSTTYDNNEIKKDSDLINKKIVLSADSEKIYNNISNLINNIWSKTSSIELDELYQKQPQLFNDPNLFIKVYAALSRNKFKQPVRRKIMQYFDNCFSSPEIIDKAYKIMNELGEDLLLSHEI